jgi:hypothetical protein
MSPRYGTINKDLVGAWFELPPEQDGPFWALNLMKYREVADYSDGRRSTASGKDADDEYTPLGPLKSVGAIVAFHGDVEQQRGAEPRWDRVGIVRYPSRAAFFAMQQRDDFKRQHEHKDAGMEFTIVMSCLPDITMPPDDAHAGDALVLRVCRTADGRDVPAVAGALRVATFDVEGVIVGDERTWTRAVFDQSASDVTTEALLTTADGVEEQFALVLDSGVDRLVSSIRTAPPQPV